MINKSIKQVNLLKIAGENAQEIYYGGIQKWYSSRWKRLSGCGPTVVSTIMNYYYRTCDNDEAGDMPFPIAKFRKLMEDVWKYVTPTMRGIPNTDILLKGAQSYISAKNLDINLNFLDVHETPRSRPEFGILVEYLSDAFEHDMPVAFLNLNSGSEMLLDSWHWVTMISLEYEKDYSAAFIEFIDEGKITKINLLSWFKTTTLGGGFVSFHRYPESEKAND